MPGYQTREERIPIRGAESMLIRSLLDNQQFADPVGAALALGISSAAWPLFGVLWPSSRQLAARMAARLLLPDERILEVGCGLALASLVSHRRGADVTASDCHPLAAAFLLENLRLNDLPPLPYRHGDWAATADAIALDDAASPARVQGRFGLIIGSDVLYERDDTGLLSGFIERHALPTAEVLIVDPNRGNRAGFNRRMAVAGFTLDETDLSQRETGSSRTGVDGYKGRLLRYLRVAPLVS
jgi:predicted nicotinamide N-methyase